MLVLSGLILEKIYELFVGTNETVRNVRGSILEDVRRAGSAGFRPPGTVAITVHPKAVCNLPR